ncbi:MAG: S8 family serine peptidase [Oscillospiraceae bacterium]|nr:S8 family serine peptidase [Oscillospiraceae bacterium]
MKLIKIIALTLIISTIFGTAVFAARMEPKVGVIIILEENAGVETVRAAINKIAANVEWGYTYDTLMNGMSASVYASDAAKIKLVAGVKSIGRNMTYAMAEEDSGDDIEKYGIEELPYKNDTPYRGEGMVVAVIDNSFDKNSAYWALTDESTARLTAAGMKSFEGKLNADGFEYVSAKVPFVYNYCNGTTDVLSYDIHGSHICGLVGANGLNVGDGFEGIAPEAQLLMMQVYDYWGNCTTADVAAAFEDAVKLGADVINFSAGIIAGFDDGYPFDDILGEIIAEAEKSGVIVVCSAGNSGNSFMYSYYYDMYDIYSPTTDVIDNGTVATPASIGTTVAVGSLSKDYSLEFVITLGGEDGIKIPVTDNTFFELPQIGKSFTAYFDGQTLEYVPVPGLGYEEDYEGLDLTGKIALIQRGTITFVEKLLNAEAAGAVGAVVYDNVENAVPFRMVMEGANIPAVSVSKENGEIMLSHEDKTIIVTESELAYVVNPNGKLPLLTSSSGPTPSLAIKPELTAVGADVLSVSTYNRLRRLSGTSMSAGFVSGMFTVMKQYAAANGLSTEPAFLKTLMMNAAEPSVSPVTGVEYSPRVQGAGCADIYAAMKTELLITSGGGKAKIELGDKLKNSFKINFSITNITDRDINFDLTASVTTDMYTTYDDLPYFITGSPALLDGTSTFIGNSNINKYSGKPYSESIKAGETRGFTITVYLNAREIRRLEKIFTNGFFVEGYIEARTDNGTVSSIPYMGFLGDWSAIPVLEELSYEGVIGYYGMSSFYVPLRYFPSYMGVYQAGANYFDLESIPRLKHIAFSPNNDGDADEIYLSLAFLRDCEIVYAGITDSKGYVIDEIRDLRVVKTYVSADMLYIFDVQLWDGTDINNPYYIYPDGKYYFTVIVKPAAGGKEQKLVVPIFLDTEKPNVTSYKIMDTPDGKVLSINICDNHCIQAVEFYDVYNYFYGLYTHNDHDVCGEVTLEYNVQEYIDFGFRYVYVDITDYAYNVFTHRVDLNG